MKLSEINDLKLRERIQRQINEEDRALRARVHPGQPELPPGRPLDRPAKREVAGGNHASPRFLVHFRVYATRPLDWDNYCLKYLQDLLCLTGYLPDDKWNVLEGRVSSHQAHSKEEERTEIEISHD